MFDLENSDRLADGRAWAEPKPVIVLSRTVLERLASDSKEVCAAAVANWHEQEESNLADKLLGRGETAFSRFTHRIVGAAVPRTRDEAVQLARDSIKDYPSFMTCWELDKTLALASRWHSIARKMDYLDEFEVPAGEFKSMRDSLARV